MGFQDEFISVDNIKPASDKGAALFARIGFSF